MYRLFAALVVILVPSGVLAQGSAPSTGTAPAEQRPASRVEVWAGGLWSPAATGSAQSNYAPQMAYGVSTGAASLTLTLDSSAAFGFDAGARVFLTRRLGVEVAGGRTWSTLSGVNGPYSVAIDYVSRQPPDYQPRDQHFERDLPWRDTRGDRRVTTLLAGPAVRWTRGTGRVSGTVSGGLSLQRFDGAVRSLAYTVFRLGGHSTFFYSQHRVEVEPEPDAWFAGPYLATDVRLRLAARVGFVGGVRVHLADRPLTSGVRVVRLVDPDEDVFVPELPDVTRALESGATIDHAVARWQVFVGLTVVMR